jgi:chemotaxis-related protein WspB
MCHAGNNRYAIDTADVIEVVPLVNFDTLANAPEWLTGVFAHRGAATPLVDLTLLLTGHPCPRRWNSRIILVRFDVDTLPDKIGLLAERVTTAEIEDQPPTTTRSVMETLGPIRIDPNGMFQLADLSRLLTTKAGKALQTGLEKRNV